MPALGLHGMVLSDLGPLVSLWEFLRLLSHFRLSTTQIRLATSSLSGQELLLVQMILAMTTIGPEALFTTAITLPSTWIMWPWRVELMLHSQDQLPNARSPSLRSGTALIPLPSQARMQRMLSLIKHIDVSEVSAELSIGGAGLEQF